MSDKNLFLEIPKNSQEKKISKAYSDVIYHLWDNNNKKGYFSPDYFKKIISKEEKMFEGIAANDSKDLILFLYQNMHKELNEKEKHKNSEIESDQTDPEIEIYKCRRNFESSNKSIISDLFYFDQGNITKCLNCGRLIYNFSMYNILIFPLEKTRFFKLNKQQDRGLRIQHTNWRSVLIWRR